MILPSDNWCVQRFFVTEYDNQGIKQKVPNYKQAFQEAKSVTYVLREMLLKTHSVKSAEENKGDKMELLYSYLTGVEFRQQVEAIVEGFTEMKSELEKEKRAFRKIWKVREKQIDKVISNTIDMHGAIKGIAGNAIQSVNALELPEPIED